MQANPAYQYNLSLFGFGSVLGPERRSEKPAENGAAAIIERLPEDKKYVPWDIQNPYDQMWQGCSQSMQTPTLQELVRQFDMDVTVLAALMSQILNQDLPIQEWLPPYRFSAICVEKDAVARVLTGPIMRNLIGPSLESLALIDGMLQ
jgi:hypothetical protein